MKEVKTEFKESTIAIDFDGVIHQYSKGFQGLDNAYDPPMPGAIPSLQKLKGYGYRLIIVSSRPVEPIRNWLEKYNLSHFFDDVTNIKHPAKYYIDDHAIRFDKTDSNAWDKTLMFIEEKELLNENKFSRTPDLKIQGNLLKHKTHKIHGWHSPEQDQFYKNFVTDLINGLVVEIGVYGGASLLSIVEICQNTNTQIFGIDPWENLSKAHFSHPKGQRIPVSDFRSNQAQLKAVRLNLENIIQVESYEKNITLLQDFSYNVHARFDEESIDVLYLDANHDYDFVLSDLRLWFSKIKSGGVLWGDDWRWKGVRKAVQDFCKENKIKFEAIGRNSWKIIKQ